MGTARWGFERSTGHDFMGLPVAETDCDEEDHVAGLVKEIAHAMLDEEDDGESKSKTVWESHSVAQASEGMLCKDTRNSGTSPKHLRNWADNEAMELLYMELVRLKMEELAVAQHQLSVYQKALMDARHTPRLGLSSTDFLGPETVWFIEHQSQALDVSNRMGTQSIVRQVNGGEWAISPSTPVQRTKHRGGPPMVVSDGRYPLSVVPSTRESGGTGVFLPRCRGGARHLRTMESKRKSDVQFPVVNRSRTVVPHYRKEDVGRSSVKCPAFSTIQEVSPEISLPTEWSY